MIEKKRRDITLGEMQDECRKRSAYCNKNDSVCIYSELCSEIKSSDTKHWNLADPPRFNEAQMAFWRGLYAIGIKRVRLTEDKKMIHLFDGKDAFAVSTMSATGIETGLSAYETIDLGDVVKKEGANADK